MSKYINVVEYAEIHYSSDLTLIYREKGGGGGNFRLNRVCDSLSWFFNLRHVKSKIYFVLLRNVLLTIYPKKGVFKLMYKTFQCFLSI